MPTAFETACYADTGHCFLIELYPAQLAATRDLRQFGQMIGVDMVGTIPDAGDQPAPDVVTLLFSDIGYVTPPGGTFGSEYFVGRAEQPLRLTRSLPVAPEGERNVASETVGIELQNNDGGLDDYLRQYTLDGRKVVVKFGLDTYAYSDFETIYSGRGTGWRGSQNRLSISARDESYRLDVTLQQSFYDGSGGVNGTSELAGKPLPLCFGKCLNVTPVFVDPTNLVYQFHARQAQAIDAAYDRGAALSFDADVADYAALIARVIPAGYYATCKALGLIRLQTTPTGLVTADVKGDAVVSYINTTGAIMVRMMEDFVGISAADIYTAAFTALDVDVTGVIGWYRTSETIIAKDALSQLARHCAAWWGGSLDQQITVGRLEEPDETEPGIDFMSWDIQEAYYIDPPAGTSPPRGRQRVAYARNWTVQRGEDLASSVSAARRQFLAEAYSVVSSESPEAQYDFPNWQDVPVLESFFDQEADAQTECDRLIRMLGFQRQVVKVLMGPAGNLVEAGGMVSITHTRINGGDQWYARVIAEEVDGSADHANFVLWG